MEPGTGPTRPLGLLLESLKNTAAAVDLDYNVHTFGEASYSILRMPYRHIRPVVSQMAARTRTRAVEGEREDTVGLTE